MPPHFPFTRVSPRRSPLRPAPVGTTFLEDPPDLLSFSPLALKRRFSGWSRSRCVLGHLGRWRDKVTAVTVQPAVCLQF